MARQEVERLIGRAVLDPEFREKLLSDPERAIREGGFDLSEEEIAGIKRVDPQAARDAIEGMTALSAQPWAG